MRRLRQLMSAGAVALGAGLAGFASAAHAAMPSCDARTLRAAAPPGLAISGITDLNPDFPKTTDGIAYVRPNAIGPGSPEFCLVTGTIVTNPATGKTANFGALLPAPSAWNGRFMFNGCAFNCGVVFGFTNPAASLLKGFPIWATDGGHSGFLQNNPPWPIVAPGQPDQDAITDFAYRATHAVTVAGKRFTLNFYNAEKLHAAYFEGCSDGGRDAFMEAIRFPEDYDGILAGAPYFDAPGQALNIADTTAQLRSRAALLSPALFGTASRIANRQCDAADGVADGLIQNPAICRLNPQTDLPRCGAGTQDEDCFTQDQIDSLSNVLAGLTDPRGTVIHPGFTVDDMNELGRWVSTSTPPANLSGPQPWPEWVGAPIVWLWGEPTVRYLVYRGDPGFNGVTTPGFAYQAGGSGPVGFFHTIAPEATVERFFGTMNIAASNFPEQLSAFIAQGRKLIVYHGYADGLITPYGTIQYYRELARLHGSYSKLVRNVRLFMPPGMLHCHGGPGPNNFGQFAVPPGDTDPLHDATTALMQWVEHGQAPDRFIASKFRNDDPGQPALRTMPLCPFPAKAQYAGSGEVTDAANWHCPASDESLLEVGPDGHEAGVDAPLFTGRQGSQ